MSTQGGFGMHYHKNSPRTGDRSKQDRYTHNLSALEIQVF